MIRSRDFIVNVLFFILYLYIYSGCKCIGKLGGCKCIGKLGVKLSYCIDSCFCSLFPFIPFHVHLSLVCKNHYTSPGNLKHLHSYHKLAHFLLSLLPLVSFPPLHK